MDYEEDYYDNDSILSGGESDFDRDEDFNEDTLITGDIKNDIYSNFGTIEDVIVASDADSDHEEDTIIMTEDVPVEELLDNKIMSKIMLVPTYQDVFSIILFCCNYIENGGILPDNLEEFDALEIPRGHQMYPSFLSMYIVMKNLLVFTIAKSKTIEIKSNKIDRSYKLLTINKILNYFEFGKFQLPSVDWNKLVEFYNSL